MAKRIKDVLKGRYKKAIQDVVQGLSRNIIVYKIPIKHECLNCYFDNVTSKSANKCKWSMLEAINKQSEWAASNDGVRYKYFKTGRCPICAGNGFLLTKRKRYIKALVHWKFGEANSRSYGPSGKSDPIWVRLKVDPKYFELFKNVERVVIDGIDCEVVNYPNIRGMGNDSTLVVTAFTKGYNKDKIDKLFRY